jgi:hypothetical protein
MIENTNGFFCLTPQEFAQQCELANAIPRLTTVEDANAEGSTGLRAWPSGLLPWTAGGCNVHALCWSDGRCMVSNELYAAMGGAL